MKKLYAPGRPHLLIYFFVIFFSLNIAAQPVITFFPVVSGLSDPIDLVHAGDGSNRVFIVQQGGDILVYDSDFEQIGTFLTVTGIVSGGEQGLLSMAFDPDYANPDPEIGGFFYVYYTNSGGDLELTRYQVSADPNVADPGSRQVVMTIPHPGNSNHNGAKLNFGPDGYLYFATGDGGGGGDVPNNAQSADVLLGKMLRIDVSNSEDPPFYTIPPGNPWAGPGDPLDEIWAFGLRNPFRWSFDRLTQGMWIGDVGQGEREEINFRAAGTTGGINYGWRCYEGNLPYNTSLCGPMADYVFPVYDYENPPSGAAAVTGGVVYRGSAYPSLFGYYFAADVYSGDLYIIDATNFSTTIQTGLPGAIVCFGETENGEVYAVSLSGDIFNVGPDPILPVTLTRFTADAGTGDVHLVWETSAEQDLKHFEVEFSYDGVQFGSLSAVPAENNPSGAEYDFTHTVSLGGQAYYRLKIVDLDGSFRYSSIVPVLLKPRNADFVHPSVIRDGNLVIYLNESWESVELINMQGALLMRKNIAGQIGRIQLTLNPVVRGVCLVRLRKGQTMISQKIFIQ